MRAITAQPFQSGEAPHEHQQNTTNNLTTLPSQPKPQTSKEVIAANVQLLIEQLEQGHSEALTDYLTAMGRFHSYSLGNILEIARQMPAATRVAGLYAWNQLGRKVKKGEKGIRLSLAGHRGIPRENEPDFLTEASKAFAKQKVQKTGGAKKPTLVRPVTVALKPAAA